MPRNATRSRAKSFPILPGETARRQQSAALTELTEKAKDAARVAELATEAVAAIVQSLEIAFHGHVRHVC